MEYGDSICLKVGRKRIRISVELCDSEDEFEEMLSSSILDKYGLNPLTKEREMNGEYSRICLPLRQHPDGFKKYFRMSMSTYDYILNKIRDDITITDSYLLSTSVEEMMAITIRYLSTGISFEELSQSFIRNAQAIEAIVRKVCELIYENLRSEFMPVPSPARFKDIAAEYQRLWQFPNCIGAIDGKHIRVKLPANGGSTLSDSVILQAVADAHYKFVLIDVTANGTQSDGSIFKASSLSKFIDDRKNFPDNCAVKGLNLRLPCLFVCDDAYPLKTNMMKRYSVKNLTPQMVIFNERLSRARKCVKYAFGILVNKWSRLLNQIETGDPSTAEVIVKCVTVLHNVIIDEEGVDENLLDRMQENIDGIEAAPSLRTGCHFNHSAVPAKAIRDLWAKYFSSPAGSAL